MYCTYRNINNAGKGIGRKRVTPRWSYANHYYCTVPPLSLLQRTFVPFSSPVAGNPPCLKCVRRDLCRDHRPGLVSAIAPRDWRGLRWAGPGLRVTVRVSAREQAVTQRRSANGHQRPAETTPKGGDPRSRVNRDREKEKKGINNSTQDVPRGEGEEGEEGEEGIKESGLRGPGDPGNQKTRRMDGDVEGGKSP